MVVLVGVADGDTSADAAALAAKLAGLRIFGDDAGLMNRSVVDVGGSVLLVSQFTLLGDVRKGRRPSFTGAAQPEIAEPLFNEVVTAIRAEGIDIATGRFGAVMTVSLVNDGPVTLIIETAGGKVA